MGIALSQGSGIYNPTTGAFSSFAGANAVVSFEGAVIANLQSITINTTREIVPVYVLGSADPKSFNRNKRAIAGSMVMMQFDKSMLIETLKSYAVNSEYRWKVNQGMFGAAGNTTRGYTSRDSETQDYVNRLLSPAEGTGATSTLYNAFMALSSSIAEYQFLTQNQLAQTGSPFRRVPYVYEDQLPKFDICIQFANEDNATAHLNIRGCMIMNTSYGISIDDALSEKAMTFVAMRLEDLQPGLKINGTPTYTDPPVECAMNSYQDDFMKLWPNSSSSYMNSLMTSSKIAITSRPMVDGNLAIA